MKLLQIRIPLAPTKTMIPCDELRKVVDSAYAELCQLIPGMRDLKNSWTRLSIMAISDQDYLVATLLPSNQLTLNLAPSDWKLGRVAELDASIIDQHTLQASLELTEDLIAACGGTESDAVRDGLEKIEQLHGARKRNRLRRQLGTRYEIAVFGEQRILNMPALQLTYLDTEIRTISCVVRQMSGTSSFTATKLMIAQGHGFSGGIDPRQVWKFIRRGLAQTLSAGRALHDSMALRKPIAIRGRLVIHTASKLPISIEVDEVE